MAAAVAEYFDDVIARFQAVFDQVVVIEREERPDVAVLEMVGTYGPCRVRLSEILVAGKRHKYAYYVLEEDEVVVGFDNRADPRALKLRYGKNYTQHRLELIPHCHTESKTKLSLTEEMDCARFIAWVQSNL